MQAQVDRQHAQQPSLLVAQRLGDRSHRLVGRQIDDARAGDWAAGRARLLKQAPL